MNIKKGDKVWYDKGWWYVKSVMTHKDANWVYSLWRNLENYWSGSTTVFKDQEHLVKKTRPGQQLLWEETE